METTMNKKPTTAEEGYEMVSGLIFDQVHKFRRRYGGNMEDLVSEAYVAFMKGHHQYIGGTTPGGKHITHGYDTEIRRWVWFELFDAMRSRFAQKNQMELVTTDTYEPADPVKGFMAGNFVSDLTPDGRTVAELVLNPPEDLMATITAKGGTPRNYRSTIRTHLTECGWQAGRINNAFAEITAALG